MLQEICANENEEILQNEISQQNYEILLEITKFAKK
jgi:hypothetical protein